MATSEPATAQTADRPEPHAPDWVRIGAGLLALGVGLAAFGAHGLESMVEAKRVATWQTGVRLHMWNALGLMILGTLPRPPRATGWLIAAGIALFSGSLYLLVLLDQGWLGAITPLGGLSFIAGWAILAFKGWKHPSKDT